MNSTQEISIERPQGQRDIQGFEVPVDVRTAARFLASVLRSCMLTSSESRFPISE